MEEKAKRVTLPVAIVIMLVIVALIMICIKTGIGIVVPLFLSWLVIYIVCRLSVEWTALDEERNL